MLRWGLTSLPEYRGNPLEPIEHEARISRIHDTWVSYADIGWGVWSQKPV
jgi:hypothetical protein